MSDICDNSLTEYLDTRRALGTQLRWPESSLRRFVDFIEAAGAKFVTTDLAVRWAVEPVGVQRATHARRLSIVLQIERLVAEFIASSQLAAASAVERRRRRLLGRRRDVRQRRA